MLALLPFVHVYQTYVAAHAYDLLLPSEKQLYDVHGSRDRTLHRRSR